MFDQNSKQTLQKCQVYHKINQYNLLKIEAIDRILNVASSVYLDIHGDPWHLS